MRSVFSLFPVLLWQGEPAQGTPFESRDFGVRLKIPAGWSVDSTREPHVLLKIQKSGDFVYRPTIQLYEAVAGDPITPGQFKESMRTSIQRLLKEARIFEDQAVQAGGRPGFSFFVRVKADVDLVVIRSILGEGPKRYLGVDANFPEDGWTELRKDYDALLASIEFTRRRSREASEKELKPILDAFQLLAEEKAEKKDLRDELVIYIGEKEFGTFHWSIRDAASEGVEGFEVESVQTVDLGEEGKQTIRVLGFLSRDMSIQKVFTEQMRVSRERKTVYFTAEGKLSGGRIHVVRRINGEKSEWTAAAEPGGVFADLIEGLLWRLAPLGKRLVAIPAIDLFDPEAGLWRIEFAGLQKMREGEKTVEIYVAFQVRDDGQLTTFWYDADRHLIRRNVNNGPQMKRKP